MGVRFRPRWRATTGGLAAGAIALTMLGANADVGLASTHPLRSIQTIAVSQVGPDAGKWPLYAAINEGFFRQEGLAVTLSVSGSSPAGVTEVIGHSVDISEVSPSDVISAAAGGGSVELIASEEALAPYVVVAAKGITSFAQLKGKAISVAAPTNITQLYWNAVARKNHLSQGDFSYIDAPTTGDRYASLVGGVVQATLLTPPASFEAEAQGFPAIAKIATYSRLPFTDLLASPAWAKSHKAELVDFLKAYLRGIAWVYNPANKAAAIQLLETYTNANATNATATYIFFVDQLKTMARSGQVNVSDIRIEAQAMIGLGAFKSAPVVSKIVNNSYVIDAAKALHLK